MKKILIVLMIVVGLVIFSLNFSNENNTNKAPENTSIDDACIILIEGNKYDVTQLRKTHPGGDIYNCGSDMTETFKQQHGLDFERIEKYRINE